MTCLLGVFVDSGCCFSDWNCQESRVEVLEQVRPESSKRPVGAGLEALANQTRVICYSAYGTFSAGFILDERESFFLSSPQGNHLFFVLHTRI